MNISAKMEYACVAVLELASQFAGGEPVRIREIADNHGIPARFLVQILLQLKGAGLVVSTRGAAGGYKLALPPDQITLAQVMGVIDGQAGETGGNTNDDSPLAKALRAAWADIAAAEQQMLNDVTFAALVERARGQTENMYYI